MSAIEVAGTGGSRPAIAADTEGQPHVVVQGDRGVLKLYDRISGTWRTPVYFTSSAELNFPRTVIDQHNNRQWVSAVMIQFGNVNGCGMAILTRSNVDDTPSAVFATKDTIGDPSGIPLCMIDLNASRTDLSYVYGNYGVWREFGVNANGTIRTTGNDGAKLFTRNLGERNLYGFAISPAGGMWHASYNGHPQLSSVRYSGYLNDARVSAHQGEAAWNDPAIYSASGGADEDKYQAICADAKVNNAAYFATYGNNGRIYVNIYNGVAMLYPRASPLSMSSDSGISRYAPQWAMAKDGGAWLCWQSNGRILTRYFGLDGVHGPIVDVASGVAGTIACGIDGNLHIAFMATSQTKYRKLLISGYNQIAPKGNVTDHLPTFEWDDSSTGTDAYTVICSNTTAGTETFVTNLTGDVREVVSPVNLDLGRYSWSISRTEGSDTKWLGPLAFAVVPATPALHYPAASQIIADPDDNYFTWLEIDDADRYLMSIERTGVVFRTMCFTNSNSTNWIPDDAELWPGGSYTWQLTPSNSVAGIAGTPTAKTAFSLAGPAAPTILLPANGAASSVTGGITFAWTKSQGATSYQIWMNRNGKTVWKSIAATDTNWIPDAGTTPTLAELDPGTYEWWVRGSGFYGSGAWSAMRTFSRRRDMTPDNGAVVTEFRPEFFWSASAGAADYAIWINRNGKKYYSGFVGNRTNWTSTVDLPFGNYTWWIRDWSNSVYGPWLSAATFTIPDRTPVATTLFAPTGVVSATGNRWFEWSNVTASTWYKILINRGSTRYYSKWLSGGALSNRVSLLSGDYTWWVQTYNIDGFGPWSAGTRFSCAKCKISAPASGTVVAGGLPALGWIGLPAATNYKISLYRNGSLYRDISVGGPATTYTPVTAWPAGNYQWWVKDVGGAGIWSAPSRFSIP